MQHTGCTWGMEYRQLQTKYSQSPLSPCRGRNEKQLCSYNSVQKLIVNQHVMFLLYYTLHLIKKSWVENLFSMPGRIILHIWRKKENMLRGLSKFICLGRIPSHFLLLVLTLLTSSDLHQTIWTIVYMNNTWWRSDDRNTVKKWVSDRQCAGFFSFFLCLILHTCH